MNLLLFSDIRNSEIIFTKHFLENLKERAKGATVDQIETLIKEESEMLKMGSCSYSSKGYHDVDFIIKLGKKMYKLPTTYYPPPIKKLYLKTILNINDKRKI
ncbi:MAG: hypothetical protein GY870_05395 [archaeon]|nr:hypothetical protein [archaeon]